MRCFLVFCKLLILLLQHDCVTATTCNHMGPHLAGMSTAACDAQGGTWCPQSSDCQPLQECIQEDIDRHEEAHPAYAFHLKLAPEIKDPSDHKQCARCVKLIGLTKDCHCHNPNSCIFFGSLGPGNSLGTTRSF